MRCIQVQEAQQLISALRPRIIPLLIVAAVLGTLIAPASYAAAEPGVSLSLVPSTSTVAPGQSFTLDVVVETPNPSRGAGAGLQFDPAMVQVDGVSDGPFYQRWGQETDTLAVRVLEPIIDNTRGRVSPLRVSLAADSGQGPTGRGVLCTYQLTAKAAASGTAAFTLTSPSISNPAGFPVEDVLSTPVSITIGVEAGTVTDRPAQRSSPARPTPTRDTSSVADNAGTPSTSTPAPPIPNASLTPFYNSQYDLNGDGVCDINDVVALTSRWGQIGPPGWIREDVNSDGTIDYNDVATINQNFSGRTSQVGGARPATPPRAPSPTPALTLAPKPKPTLTPPPRPVLKPELVFPDRPAPTPITKTSKLGVGVYGLHAGDGILYALLAAEPGVIILQDPDVNFLKRVRYCFPNAFIVGRTFFAEQPLDNPEQRGIEAADRVATMAVPFKGLIDAWMSYNEPIGHNDYAGYQAYNRFQVAFAKRLQNHYGIPAVAGNDPPGAIEPSDYPKYFGEAIRESQYFGIHAYAGPGAITLDEPDAQYFALRYRLIQKELESAGITDTKMVITEVGLGNGWRGIVSPEEMASQFKWLADELEKDRYMLGMGIYGMFNSPGWEQFDILDTPIPDLLGAYQPRRSSGQR